MERDDLMQSIEMYKKQLNEVELAIVASEEGPTKDDLKSLRNNIQELINLTEESWKQTVPQTSSENDPFEDEFSLFMTEMEKEGATSKKPAIDHTTDIQTDLNTLEGMKCRAPHKHQWGDVLYHNAVVCSVIPFIEQQTFEELQVKVMFINPTHQEMLPCPYLMESDCKFDDDRCKYSHGEIVLFSSLQEYTEPNFELLTIGSSVLAKQNNKLWSRAVVKKIFGQKCLVKFDTNKKDLELELHDVLLLQSDDEENCSSDDLESQDENNKEDIINTSLMNAPASQALGDWEKHTKGIGSKLMEKMGYVIGTGLGRFSDGRTEPVSAVVLPPGKSLDHCMHLREKAGGDEDLFSVEKKLKRLQKKQELRNMKAYEREKKRVDVFSFLNSTLSGSNSNGQSTSTAKSKHRLEIKKETSRNLNVASLQIDEDIKRTERDLDKIRDSLKRHSDVNSQVYKNLKQKLHLKQKEIQTLKSKASNISMEQSIRNDKKKMCVF